MGQAMRIPGTGNAMTGPARRLAALERLTSCKRIGGEDAEMFVLPDFISQKACEEIIALAETSGYESRVADDNNDASFRTSRTTDVERGVPVADIIRGNVAQILGLQVDHAEDMQAQRYLPGQEFKAHLDTFRPGSDSYVEHCTKSGQRTWTAMVYLNDVEEGGETEFPRLGISQKPIAGTMLVWNNLTPDGHVNPFTLHHARQVLKGVKYVATIWFRERPWT